MRKIALVIFVMLLTLVQLPAQEKLRIMESLVMPSSILGHDVKYSVCLPEDYYEDDQHYPVVYMLHGLGDDAASWLEYGRISQYYDNEIEDGAVVPMIFIMPEGYRNYYVNDYKGSFLYQDMFLKELVPYIDSMFRTVPNRQHRGLIGYSMGGFGALILHLQHPDIFGSAVPLSISIRTDEQYIVEYAPEWDEQWGRLFGAVGIEGPGRITDYYKLNSPFYIIPKLSSEEKNQYRIYIDNGDKEETLCRSNEELHIMMRNEDFPHEFRVREGGHSFSYWCSALPNALHFLSDAFENKPYRGDIEPGEFPGHSLPEKAMIRKNIKLDNVNLDAFVPEEYNRSSRLYPVLYVLGDFSDEQALALSKSVNNMILENEISPMMLVFIPESLASEFEMIIPKMEEQLRIRKGYRFRSLLGYHETANLACDIAINREQFSSCVLIDGYLDKNFTENLLQNMKPEALKRTPFYILTTDEGSYYEGNGYMHMMLRDKEIRHEYRVIGGFGDWGIGGFEDLGIWGFGEIILFVSQNFHR